ncbi:replicative DNA helicase [Paenibacillus herberti]|uniref:DNA 5'-3' helicase n=1 Tax=Paenibacillus herberti TaxID=1619309 RepID=A0A229P672_9BACL|nr:replicative DNA helicase [Paenibacillus herberti]
MSSQRSQESADVNQVPFDTHLEEHILGAMVYEPACIAEVFETVQPRYFYHTAYSKLCKRIFELWEDDPKQIDLTALIPALEDSGVSVSKMAEMTRNVITTLNITSHCERLRDIAALRAGIRTCQELVQQGGLRDRDEIREAITTTMGKLSRVSDMTIKVETMVDAKTAAMNFHDSFERMLAGAKSGMSGIPTKIHALDKILSGLQDNNLIVIGARPSMGKTTLMNQLALNISLADGGQPGEPGAIFSLESSSDELARRMVSNISGISLQSLKAGTILPEEWEKYTMAISILSNANFVIDDQAGTTVAEIKAKARKIQRERGLRYILIDYLGKIGGAPGAKRYDLVSENIRGLKDLAKELKVPVVVFSQLSRKVEERQSKRPLMSDLRESGEIEQEADVIGFLYRDDYYDKESSKKNIIELDIAKQRDGPLGTVEMAFLKDFNRLVNLDRGENARAEQMALV